MTPEDIAHNVLRPMHPHYSHDPVCVFCLLETKIARAIRAAVAVEREEIVKIVTNTKGKRMDIILAIRGRAGDV